MPLRFECDRDPCENDIKGTEGIQVTEGEVVIDHGNAHIQQDVFHGLFCSKECLREHLKDRGDSEQ
ncbi:hypothetical protein KY092_08105 [Natronomonas gomsonensis]|uniref:hypothetical protein n=1 Tax=Natronomonas gomsonensis TaxID=1046043 RepID=UPI00227A2E77|nr:hypothetical protein [Natronomonas gomsonensis]MCY4730520.1 hypothetical protein [Natronomonas gomsonensis]